jgi:hypothetical protein
MASAWPQGHVLQVSHFVRRGEAGLAAVLVPTWDLDGSLAAYLTAVRAPGSVSTPLMISKAVSARGCFIIDVLQTDESVAYEGGGCMYPLTAYSPIGRDCSALPGVADVSCLGGECIVHRCLPGYVLAFDGTSCIRKHHISHSQFVDPEDVPARVYGLEHVPLGRH